MSDNNTPRVCPPDLVSSPLAGFFLWWLPTGTILLGFVLPQTTAQIVWALCYGIMGLGCGFNAKSCYRVHCHFTAPWFLFIAAIFTGIALALVPSTVLIERSITAIGLAGFVLIWFISEKLWGAYYRPKA